MVRDARELRGAWATFQSHWYGVPSAELAPFVSGYWAAEWDLRGQEPYRQKIVPYPKVQLTFRDGDAVVRGPERGHVVRVLAGRGLVFGAAFRPGCFRPFLGASISTITGRSLAAAAVFGPGLATGCTRWASGLPPVRTSTGCGSPVSWATPTRRTSSATSRPWWVRRRPTTRRAIRGAVNGTVITDQPGSRPPL